MKKVMTSVPFRGTPEQLAELDRVIEENKNEPGATLAILQKAQDIYGYLPEEVQRHIALALDIPFSEVYGIATFYAQFQLNPKGEHPVSVCLGTACYVKGSADILAELEKQLGIEAGHTTPDGKFTLEATRCLGCCGLAPVFVVDDEVYGRLTPSDVKGILDKYRA